MREPEELESMNFFRATHDLIRPSDLVIKLGVFSDASSHGGSDSQTLFLIFISIFISVFHFYRHSTNGCYDRELIVALVVYIFAQCTARSEYRWKDYASPPVSPYSRSIRESSNFLVHNWSGTSIILRCGWSCTVVS
jgi:hypothetical protein